MKLSARNVLQGKVLKVTKGATTAHVLIEVAPSFLITASITNESVELLEQLQRAEKWRHLRRVVG